MAEEKTISPQEEEVTLEQDETAGVSASQEEATEDMAGEASFEEASAESGAKEQETESGAEEAGAQKPAKGEKKSPFKKKEKKKDKRDERIEELTDQVKRQMAEFENFRKRTEKEKSQMYEIGAKSIVEKILPVVDNFERGLAAVPEELQDNAFVDGMDKIYKQMMTVFEEMDVKPIEAVGKEFDPEFHNAVMQVESEEYQSGVVAQELQKGYTYRGAVVRHSMVAVVQ